MNAMNVPTLHSVTVNFVNAHSKINQKSKTMMMMMMCVSPVLAGVRVAESNLGVWSVLRLTVAIVDHLHGFISYPHAGHNCPPLTCTNTNTHTHT